MRPSVIFLDNGGVLTDNDLRAQQWRQLVGEYLAPRLGGDQAAWGEANRVAFDMQWKRFEAWRSQQAADRSADFFGQRQERIRWLAQMCAHVGVDTPADHACYELALATEEYVFPRVLAPFPEVISAVQSLHERGYALATASGEPSTELQRYVTSMGIRDRFSYPLYGPDLVDSLKAGTEYYRRIFEHAAVQPGDALVVDNEPGALSWAAEAGARTAHLRRDGSSSSVADVTVTDLGQLVGLLDSP